MVMVGIFVINNTLNISRFTSLKQPPLDFIVILCTGDKHEALYRASNNDSLIKSILLHCIKKHFFINSCSNS